MRTALESPVTLSVLDRLIDLDPRSQREVPLSRAQSVSLLKSSVRRDLEWLLNNRRIADPPDPSLVEVNNSVYVIGLADLSSFSLSDPRDRARLLQQVQSAIRLFEPRLTNVRVTQPESPHAARVIRFRIDASLMMDPAPERVSFDTTLELAGGYYEVEECGHAG